MNFESEPQQNTPEEIPEVPPEEALFGVGDLSPEQSAALRDLLKEVRERA